MRFIINTYLYILILSPYTFLRAQQEKHLLREGNKEYFTGNYKNAEKYYSEALKKKNNYSRANFNLGDSYYKEGKMTDAIGQYDVFIKNNNNKDTLARAFHNMGNAYLKTKSYEDAIKAYKNSLKFNPKDEDTRYNLAYALKKMQEQKKNGGQNNKEIKDEKNKEKKQKENKGQQGEQQEKNQMSKEEAQRMLEALKNAEQKLQLQRKQKGDKEAERKKIEKDW